MPQPIFDGHHDALTHRDHAGIVTGREGGHFDLPRAAAGGLVASMWAIFCHGEDTNLDFAPNPGGGYDVPLDPEVPHPAAAAEATTYAGRLIALEHAGDIRIARSIDDLDAAADGSGPPAAVMHLEGAEPIDTTLEALDTWHAMGLRSIGPVWSRPNRFGHGVPFRFPSTPDTGEGLTPAGRALVTKCEALKIAVDVSHLNARGFWDVAELTGRPVIATHCGAHAVAPASRNLTDDQLDAIGSSGGIVGIPYIVDFLRADGTMDPNTPLSTVVAHVRHVADRIGVDHVGFGSDFDGGVIPDPIGDAAGLPGLLEALADDGFTPEDINKIAWSNWRRVLAAAWA
ncbi:dipeptidase [Baekduia sp. Peel2402]|uniref:dipeptidase n=1 Tax=Baekduia sp. Peel2402 TaxID=3458296 RepID=UPI00403E7654